MVQTLVVDDSADTRIVLGRMVRQAGGQVAGYAATGAEALVWLEQHAVDLVLTDFQMPGMRGDELAREIQNRWPNVPIAVITIMADQEVEQTVKMVGVGWLLSKPTTVNQIARIIRAVTGRRARLSEGSFQ